MKSLVNLVSLSILSLLTACTPFARHETVSKQLVTIDGVTTNFVSNGVTQTLFIPPMVITNLLTNFTYTVSPEFRAFTTTIGDLNNTVPSPASPFINIGLLLATGIATAVAKVKSRKAALVPTLIAGIENGVNNEQVKAAVELISKAAGHKGFLDDTVQSLTKK